MVYLKMLNIVMCKANLPMLRPKTKFQKLLYRLRPYRYYFLAGFSAYGLAHGIYAQYNKNIEEYNTLKRKYLMAKDPDYQKLYFEMLKADG